MRRAWNPVMTSWCGWLLRLVTCLYHWPWETQTGSKQFPVQARRDWGCDGCTRTPLQAAEIHFFVDQRFSRLELGTLLKDHDDQHCWSSWFAAANPVDNTDFQLYFYFCSFSIVTFSKAVKYIHKVVSSPKKSILKFNGLSNIHIFKFAFGCLFHIILPLKCAKCTPAKTT